MSRYPTLARSSRNRGRLVCLVAVTLIAGTAVAQPAATETRDISGTVVDIDAAPIADAKVTVACGEAAAITAADGSFQLTAVPITDAVIEVVADEFFAKRVAIPDSTTALQLQLMLVRTVPVVDPPARVRAIGGVVRDPHGAPISRAIVRVRGTELHTFSTTDGSFTLRGVGLGDVDLEVEVAGRRPTRANVPRDKAAVVVTVGTDVSPAVPTRSEPGSDLRRSDASSIVRLPLRITSPFADKPAPLYVLDGIVVSDLAELSGAYALLVNRPVDQVAGFAIGDIEAIDVLDGAGAVAMYGPKAENGVVAITTKRSRARASRATVTQRMGFAQPAKKLGARTFGSLDEVRDIFCDPQGWREQCDRSAPVEAYRATNGTTYDHEAEVLRTAIATETVGTISGSSGDTKYYGAALVRDEPGIVIGTAARKQSGRLALSKGIGTRLRIGVTANVTHTVIDHGSLYNVHSEMPLYQVLAHSYSFIDFQPTNGRYGGNPANSLYPNPIQTVKLQQNREDAWRGSVDSTLTIHVYTSPDGANTVNLLGNLGVDRLSRQTDILSPSELLEEPDDGLPGTRIVGSATDLESNAGVGALWTLAPRRHRFRSALSSGITYKLADAHAVEVTARGFPTGQPRADTAQGLTTDELDRQTTEFGLYAQEEISVLDDRLLLVAGMLGERSSRNTKTAEYFTFPKLGVVYSPIAASHSRETPALLDSLRVRVAYGEAGKPPGYGYKFAPLKSSAQIIGGVPATVISEGPHPVVEPERQRELEAGVELATKDQRVVAELTGFQRSVSNLLLLRSAATETGFTAMFVNAGGMRSRGIAAAIQVRPLATRQITWTSRGTLTVSRSVFTHLPFSQGLQTTDSFSNLWLGAHWLQPGKSATAIVGNISQNEIGVVGDSEPDFRISWSNTISLGDLALTTLIDWQHGADVVNVMRMEYDSAGNSPDVAAAERRYNAFNQEGIRPYVEDASFVKLRELAVSYALPTRLATQLGPLKRLEISLSGRNLWTFTRYSGLDPEVSNSGFAQISRIHDIAPSPPVRSYWISVTAGI